VGSPLEDLTTFEIEDLNLTLSNSVYEPAEDTFLLLDTIKHLTRSGHLDFMGKEVLELGTGIGLIALWIAIKAPTKPKRVVATDISSKTVRCARRNVTLNPTKNITVLCSDLFSAFGRGSKFDIMVFNPPYVPSTTETHRKPVDWEERAWNGGVRGREIIDRFLLSFSDYLTDVGEAFIIQSSLNLLEKTTKITKSQGFQVEIVGKTKLPWEMLMVLVLTRD